ncbi:kinase-like domain-containing protein [Ochromonadaceae sp. CCMP2298]|nr:kinase-like domain-containing protein [Ochromonadaceae sp. CCMP2298]
MRFTCRSLRAAVNSREVWADISTVFPCGRLNLAALCFRSEKSQGTEGTCMHVVGWRDGQEYALKKGRPFPQFEGVPYYMIREMSALRVLAHPCIAPLLAVSLRRSELHMLFPYVEFTLQDLLAHKAPLQRRESIDLMAQLTDAVAYCHKNGVLHRNLKPKHLLIQLAEPHASLATERLLRGARLLVSDFALVRICSRPQKAFTAEVISLWYRPPEILMGRCAYDESIDVWSMGCVFAEMLRGSALFMGISQVDQLFQVCTYACVCLNVCTYVCLFVCMYESMYVCLCVYIFGGNRGDKF